MRPPYRYESTAIMRRAFFSSTLVLCLLSAALSVLAQAPEDPVHWKFSMEKGAGKAYTLHMTANINDGWHIYAQVQPKTAISEPTRIVFTRSPLFVVHGKAKEVGKVEKQKIVEADIEQNMFRDKVDFVQSVEVKADVKASISGTITYQACTDEMCLLPKTMPFSVELP